LSTGRQTTIIAVLNSAEQSTAVGLASASLRDYIPLYRKLGLKLIKPYLTEATVMVMRPREKVATSPYLLPRLSFIFVRKANGSMKTERLAYVPARLLTHQITNDV
jgi:hypothetical protein